MHIDDQNLLTGVPYKPSPNHGARFSAGYPDAIVIHYTAGLSAESSVAWLCNPTAKASAHVVIARDGAITQLVPFDTIAWHAGRSSYGGRSAYNQFSIGIEMDNPGRLSRTESGQFLGLGRTFPGDEVIQAVHRNETTPSYWLIYPEAQLEAAFNLCVSLREKYPAIRELLGHEEIAPGRKSDPGPAFPLDQFRRRLIEQSRGEDGPALELQDNVTSSQPRSAAAQIERIGIVTATKLNIRTAPRADAPLVAHALVRGTIVGLFKEQPEPGWMRAYVPERHNISGWVKSEYIDT